MKELIAIFEPGQIRYNEPMRNHTTMRVGGPVDMMIFPHTQNQLIDALKHCPDAHVIGNGSNLIVKDGGVRGVVISLMRMNAIRIEGDKLRAEAGAMMPAIAQEALKHGLAGLEFLSGIPGTVGGGCAMNAGAYGEELSGVLTRAKALKDGQASWLDVSDLDLRYRHSRILSEGMIVLEAEFQLAPGDKDQIKLKMDDLNFRRRDKQPLNYPSSGSTFKRPVGHFAGALIEQAGLKGHAIGGAQVSEKHAGFVINSGEATASDILKLIESVQKRVKDAHGVHIECEVRIIGEE